MLNIEKIRALSKERGISMNFLCSKIGVNNHYFLDVAKKNIPVPEDRVILISETLGTTPEYLRDKTDDPAPKQKNPDWRDIEMSQTKREFWNKIDGLSDEKIEALSKIIFPILKELTEEEKKK